jgi:MFS transporter, putative metabolite:H+ symporter
MHVAPASASPTQSSGDLLSAYDKTRLTPRYFAITALLVIQEMFEYFDFFIAGYIVAVLAPLWKLTYGQSALILLNAGVGAIVGSLMAGQLADRWGRKPLLLVGGLLYSLSAGAVALIGEGDWISFAILRFLVGFGFGAAVSVQLPLFVEITPTRHRTLLSSLMLVPVAMGTLLAASLASLLLPVIGWRGLAAIGALPVIVTVLIQAVATESPRWLLSRDRFADARRAAAKQMGVPVESLPMPTEKPALPEPVPLRELFADQKRFWWVVITWIGISSTTYGIQLWGPTIVSLAMRIPVRQAAEYFVFITISSILGRIALSFVSLWLGRKRTAELTCFVAAIGIAAAGYYYKEVVWGFPVFVVLLTAMSFFYSGGFANYTPYTVEAYPVRLAARGFGLAQAANGVGKILGPLCLALIAGATDVVSPKATEDAIFPAFLFLAGCSLIAGIVYMLAPFETHGRPLSIKGEKVADAVS